MPPVRTTHVWRAPRGLWCYDMWGRHGRPVVLIPAVMFDRVMWWPAAADLRPYATVVAVDLPGHGASTRWDRYDPDELVDDLADLVHSVGVRRAPVVVGHASSAPLAVLFAARYATHAVVTVDPAAGSLPPSEVDQYLNGLHLDAIPARYRDMVTAVDDRNLLAAYAGCMQRDQPAAVGPRAAAQPARLAVYSQAPPTGHPAAGAAADQWRHEIYDVAGRFAHLADVRRFVHDIRALL
jgi:pimeloyl-ACP methyl ester carboxylesterase